MITFFSIRDSSVSIYKHICIVGIFRSDFRVSVLIFVQNLLVTLECHGFPGCLPIEGIVVEVDRLCGYFSLKRGVLDFK